MKKTPTPDSKSPRQPRRARELWPLIEGIKLPTNYWIGQQIQQDLVPDNILIFPVSRRSLSRNLGTFHPRFVLDIVTKTTHNLRIGEHHYLLEADECALIFPHQFNYGTVEQPNGDDSPGLLTITFELANPKPIASLRDHPRRLRPCDIQILREVIMAYRQSSPLALAHHLSRLLLSLCQATEIPAKRQRIPPNNPSRDLLLEQINSYLYNNREQSFTIETMAQSMGYTASQLRTLFRKHIHHTSLGSYIRSRRISAAARLIQTTDHNITQISQKLGFSSIHSFSRLFKATYGISPKQYEIESRKAITTKQ